MLNVFIGYDHRQPINYNVLQQSIVRRSSQPVSITPLIIEQLPITRQGLTPFTYSRFLVPWLCNYEGFGLFLDIDMLVLGDIAELFSKADERFAVQIVKHDGEFQFERASVMLFNCNKCRILTPHYINDKENKGLHGINFVRPQEVGELPSEWNHLVGYYNPRPDAKLVHYTQGTPVFKEIGNCEYANEWHKEHQVINSSQSWQELMGPSVHAAQLPDGRIVPKLAVQRELEKIKHAS
jgi:lipopolysaccharide biosynthesis glycosyltransferase